MKRFITIMILCMLLCSCGTPTKVVPEHTQQSGSASNSAAAVSESPLITESSAATERPTITESPVPTKRAVHAEKVTPGVVVDETGKKHKLKLGDIDLEKKETFFEFILFPTNYAQVVGGHYYFLRADGRRNYTIYRDKGEVVGKFSLKKGIVSKFGFYQNKFYAVIAKDGIEDLGKKLVEIDLKKKTIKNLCYADLKGGREKGIYVGWMYEGIYFCEYENDQVNAFDLKKKKVLTHSAAFGLLYNKKLPAGNWIDGKMYNCEIVSDKKIRIYSYNLKSGVKEKILEFKCEDNHSVKNASYVALEIDEDYIYCQDFLIPRRGGKITRLPPRVIDKKNEHRIFSNPTTTIFVYNKKYIFYLDGEGKIHRIDKKTREDVVISDSDKILPMDIRCTEDGLYVQEFSYDLSIDYLLDYDDEDDYDYDERDTELGDSCDLYYMDVNGKKVKRIWKEKDLD